MTDDNQSQAMTALNEALAAGFENADFEALRALYTEESLLLPARSRPIRGRAAIVAFWLGVRNRFAGMAFTTGEFKLLGDGVARETGTYLMAPGDGGGPETRGKFMVVWQRIEGAWLVESSIWTRNAEAPQQAAGQGGGRNPGAGGRQGAPGGGYRQGGAGSQGGYRQGGGGRHRGGIGGQQGGIGGGGGGIGGGGARRGNPQQGGPRSQGGGQGGPRQSLYEENTGLYSNRDD